MDGREPEVVNMSTTSPWLEMDRADMGESDDDDALFEGGSLRSPHPMRLGEQRLLGRLRLQHRLLGQLHRLLARRHGRCARVRPRAPRRPSAATLRWTTLVNSRAMEPWSAGIIDGGERRVPHCRRAHGIDSVSVRHRGLIGTDAGPAEPALVGASICVSSGSSPDDVGLRQGW